MDELGQDGLSASARQHLPPDVQGRVAEAWSRGRALILNANKPGYSEAFTIEAEQYTLVRQAILDAIDEVADDAGQALLKDIVASVQAELGHHPRFPKGRMTNYTRYVKTDMEARGEVARVPKSSPQRVSRCP